MRAGRWADLLFALTLRAYPLPFRTAYGEEMVACFRDGWQAAPGSRARMVHVLRAAVSNIVSGLGQRRSKRGGTAGGRGVWRLDLRHAIRSLTRHPGLASLIVATLAIGVGANAAVFGALYSVVLDPLPYPEPDRLVRIYQVNTGESDWFGGFLTLPALVDYRENARALSGIAAVYTYEPEGVDLTGAGRPERLRALRVGADYFDMLGLRPVRGRVFGRDEERADTRVAIVNGALADRLGEKATLNGITFDIIGVLPAGSEDPIMGAVDVWLPLDLPVGGYEDWQWDNHYLSAIGRIAPGRTLEEARAEIAHLSRLQGERVPEAADLVGQVVPLHADVVGESDTLLGILMGAVGLLLLLTFVNVGVLLVARSLDRTHEVAVRTALGSPRSRLARQYLFEGLLLALAGSIAGAAVALPLQRVLVATAPAGALDRALVVSPWPILGFGVAAAVVAGLVFGIAPAASLRRVDPTGALRQSGRSSDRRIAVRLREGLVVMQVALALMLLIGAGVLVKSLERLRALELNVRTENVITFEAHLPDARYVDMDAARRFRDEFQRRIEALPGVRAAGAITTLPVTGRAFVWGARRAVGDNETEGDWLPADQRVIAGDAFAVLGIPVLQGRVFGAEDGADATPRVVIGEAFAKTMFGSAAQAVGQGVRIGGERREIIGVVADVPVTARGEVAPMVYHSDAQFSPSWSHDMIHLVAMEPGAAPVLPRIAAELAALDPDLVLHQARELGGVIGAGRARERFAARLLSGFAVLAIALSALGLYGILAHAVRRRRREIGIRLALGADGRSVLGMVVRQGLTTAATGLVIGVAGAWIATRALGALVFGVGVRDGWVFAGAAATMAVVAALASALPALRAARVDPIETFRAE